MRSTYCSAVFALAVLLCGCDRKGAAEGAAPSASAKTPGAVGAEAKNSRRAQGKCPNWVPGAKTELADVEGGALLTITASDDAAVSQIRERARYLAEGRSKGGDATGQCPVIRDVKIEVSDVAGGAKVILRPNEKVTLEQLRAEVRARHARSAL
jgi:hypothetical protein